MRTKAKTGGSARRAQDRREHADGELRQFRLAIDSSPDLIYLIDPDTLQYLYVNDTACRMSGFTREEYMKLGPVAASGQSPEDLKRVYAEAIANPDHSVTTENMAIGKNGERGWFEIHRRAMRLGGKWAS